MKYKIEAVGQSTSGVSAKTNKPWYKVGLKINGEWWNGFHPENWTLPKPGDEIELELVDDGQWKNFKLPAKGKVDMSGIEERLDRIEQMIIKIGKHLMGKPEPVSGLVPDKTRVDF